MWLNLEAGVGKGLIRRHGARFTVPEHHDTQRHGPRALIVEAANSILPEADAEDLPALARAELAAGLSGRLRAAIAACEDHNPQLLLLRDELVTQLAGAADSLGAMTVTDRVYLGRMEQGIVPPAVAAGCISWYRHWRVACSGPSLDAAETMSHLLQTWQNQPDQRGQIDDELRDLAHHNTDRDSLDLIAGPI